MEFRGTSTITGGTINAIPPTVAAPVISNVSSGTPGETSATITWTTDTLSDSNICRGANGGPWNTCNGVNSSLVTSHSMVFSGLSASTTYYYKVYSTDNLGQQTISAQNSFVTTTAAGCGPPTYPCGDATSTNHVWGTWPIAAQTVNTVFNDPVFGNEMVRAVDTATTDPCDAASFNAIASSVSSSAENNL